MHVFYVHAFQAVLQMEFSIVEFLQHNEVAVVPLSGKKYWWPPFQNNKEVEKAEEPSSNTWEEYSIRIVSRFRKLLDIINSNS